MLATTLSSHWAKDWSQNSSRLKKIVLINLSISKPNGVQPHCLLDWSWGTQTKTHEWRQINTNPIWSDFAKQHNQRAIRGFILQHRLIVCDRSLNDFFQQVEVPPSLLIHGCLRQDAVSSPDWKWSYPARRFPSALFPEPVIPNIITWKIHHKTRLLKL